MCGAALIHSQKISLIQHFHLQNEHTRTHETNREEKEKLNGGVREREEERKNNNLLNREMGTGHKVHAACTNSFDR